MKNIGPVGFDLAASYRFANFRKSVHSVAPASKMRADLAKAVFTIAPDKDAS